MLAPLPFMVPGCRRLLPGPSAPVSGTWSRLERRQRPAPGSTKPRALHLRPPRAVGSRRALQALAPTAPRAQVRRRAETRERGRAGAVYAGRGGAALPAGEAARVEEEPGPSVWNPGLGRALWRRAP